MRASHWMLLGGLLAFLLVPSPAEAHGLRPGVHRHLHHKVAPRRPHRFHSRRMAHRRKLLYRLANGRHRRYHLRHGQPLRHHGHTHTSFRLPHGHQSAASLHPVFHRIARGVGYWQGRLLTPAGPVQFHALEVNLHLAKVAPVAAHAQVGLFGLERTSTMARRKHAIAGINGSFFCPSNRQPMDVLIVKGRILAHPVSRPALVVRANGTASILPDHAALQEDASYAVGGGPTLLHAGHILLAGRPHAISGREPRTAVGLCPGGKALLLTIDGRSHASVGATLLEEARYLRAMGARDAINLDGGGSTTMVVAGHVVNTPSDGVERAVSNALMVFPKQPRRHVHPAFNRYSGWDERLGSG